MNIFYTPYSRVQIVEKRDLIEPVPGYDHCVVPHRIRELVLTPREYEGQNVLAAYDRETDTLYIRAG